MSAGEPDATEIGHVRFGGGPSEKGLITGTSLAAYPTACTVRAGGLRKRTDGNVSTAPQADPTAALRAARVIHLAGRSRLAASLPARADSTHGGQRRARRNPGHPYSGRPGPGSCCCFVSYSRSPRSNTDCAIDGRSRRSARKISTRPNASRTISRRPQTTPQMINTITAKARGKAETVGTVLPTFQGLGTVPTRLRVGPAGPGTPGGTSGWVLQELK
jgi:hypothetical protein